MRINRQLNSGTDQCELIGADFPRKTCVAISGGAIGSSGQHATSRKDEATTSTLRRAASVKGQAIGPKRDLIDKP